MTWHLLQKGKFIFTDQQRGNKPFKIVSDSVDIKWSRLITSIRHSIKSQRYRTIIFSTCSLFPCTTFML
jgi:hypothetical protein